MNTWHANTSDTVQSHWCPVTLVSSHAGGIKSTNGREGLKQERVGKYGRTMLNMHHMYVRKYLKHLKKTNGRDN